MKWIMYAMHLPFRGSDAVTSISNLKMVSKRTEVKHYISFLVLIKFSIGIYFIYETNVEILLQFNKNRRIFSQRIEFYY